MRYGDSNRSYGLGWDCRERVDKVRKEEILGWDLIKFIGDG